jgi:hypothetical protein
VQNDNGNDDGGHGNDGAKSDGGALTDVMNLLKAAGSIERGSSDGLSKLGEGGLGDGGGGRIAVADSGHLACFYDDTNARQIANADKTFENDHGHNVVFVGGVEIGAYDAGDTGRRVDFKFAAGLRDFLGLGTNFAKAEFEIGLLGAGIMLDDMDSGVRANIEDGAVIERNAGAGGGFWLGLNNIHQIDDGFGRSNDGLKTASDIDSGDDAGNFTGALGRRRRLREEVKGNRDGCGQDAGQSDSGGGLGIHRGLLKGKEHVSSISYVRRGQGSNK